ncbi:MAG: sulfatase-like hydrolase/transferase [Bryobacteraceae bacterium]
MERRQFLAAAGSAALAQAARPNILWITCEDIGPQIGAYGDTYADTPNIDRLAKRSLLYRNAWSNAPVCAPARTTIISGMYPPSLGAEHMRSETSLPAGFKMFPGYLREAGYYCTNNAKEDYNLVKPAGTWDDSSNKAHWRKRASGQPFFSVFNFLITHESQIRTRPHKWVHDLSKVRVPAYHPDRREVREDWAQYYDNITTMDGQAAKVLAELEADGLADNTVVFFYGDHGSGMPRSKRWPFNSGLHVPLIAHVPEKLRHLATKDYRPGGETQRLVSFVDLAPTVLSLAGIAPPKHFQGHAFLGPHAAAEQPYVYGFRGRMDERIDMTRSVRDGRYVYLRHYMPHRIYGQHVSYMFETPTTHVWRQLFDDGKLNDVQSQFWREKPSEQLFDLQADRDETKNLADSPEHKAIVERMRKAQRALAAKIHDVGFLPEGEIHERAKGSTPYEMGHDAKKYPMEKIQAMAELASDRRKPAVAELKQGLHDGDSAVRYWAAQGALIRGEKAVSELGGELRKALADPAPYVRVVSAEALGRFGSEADGKEALRVLLELADASKNSVYVSVAALNAIGYMQPKIQPPKDVIAALPKESPGAPERARSYVPRLIEKIQADMK